MNEKVKGALRKCEWILVPLVLVVGSFLGGSHYGQQKVLANIETKSDTITKVVPVYKDFPQPAKTALSGFVGVPKYKFITDTLHSVETAYLHDTTVVYLPREEKFYSEADGRLRLWISGYEPKLDRYELDEVTNTVTNTVKVKPPRWSISINGGYGVCLNEGRVILAPNVSVGISYRLVSLR